MGSPDDSEDIFDPTSSGPSMPSPSSAHFSARPTYDLGLSGAAAGTGAGAPSSPWNRTTVLPTTEPSPKPGAGPFWSSAAASGGGGATPKMTSSPTMGGPPGGGLGGLHSSSSSSAEDIWGPGPSASLAPGAGIGPGPSSMAMANDPSGRSSRSTLPSLLMGASSGTGSTSSHNSPVQQSFQQSQAQQWQHPHALGQLYAQHQHPFSARSARHPPSTSSSSPGQPGGVNASQGVGAAAGTASAGVSAGTSGSGEASLPTSPTMCIGSGSGSGKSGATYGAIGASGTKS